MWAFLFYGYFWNYLLDLLKDESYRLNIFHEANIYSGYIYNSLLVNDINSISYDEIYYDLSVAIKPNNKHAKKIKKKLRRLQKKLKLSGLVNIISSYFDKICDIEFNSYDTLYYHTNSNDFLENINSMESIDPDGGPLIYKGYKIKFENNETYKVNSIKDIDFNERKNFLKVELNVIKEN